MAGSGKTQAIIYHAAKTNHELMRVNMNTFFEIQDFQLKLKLKNQTFKTENSAIIEAI